MKPAVNSKEGWARRLIILTLAFPFAFALFLAGFRVSQPPEFAELFVQSTLQALLSATVAVGLGLLGGVGLLGLPSRYRTAFEGVMLAGSFVPAIAWILAWMVYLPNVRGLVAIMTLQALSAAGLIASALSRSVLNHWSGALELALVEGVPKWSLWRRGLLPLLTADLVTCGVTVFAGSLSSFSIPLIMGGSKAWTFEIAIHQAIRLDGAWDRVAALTLWQGFFLFVLLLVTQSRKPLMAAEDQRNSIAAEYFGVWPLVLLGLAPVGIVAVALLQRTAMGWRQLESAGLTIDSMELPRALLLSTFSAHLAGALAALLVLSFALLRPTKFERRLLSAYVAPSTVVTGLLVLFVGPRGESEWQTAIFDGIRVALGNALVFTPVLWRIRWYRRVSELDRQIEVAQIFGATHGMIAFQIMWPQLKSVFWWTWGLTAFWVFGDFAIGSVAAARPFTLSLLARSLLESYRLEGAALLIAVCLLGGFLSFAVVSGRWGGTSHVNR